MLGAWWAYSLQPAWAGYGASGIWVLWVTFALGSWRRAPLGRIAWRASERRAAASPLGGWHWMSATCPQGTPIDRVELMLDARICALLRLQNADSLTRWVWVERARDPLHWGDLRRALVASRA